MTKLLAAVLLAIAWGFQLAQAAVDDENDVWARSLGIGNAPVEPRPPVVEISVPPLPPAVVAPSPPPAVAPITIPASLASIPATPPAAPPARVVAPAPVVPAAPVVSPSTVRSPAPATPAPPPPIGAEGSLFLAGNQFSLEQAFADATIERLDAPISGPFAILAIEREAAKLTAKGAKPNVKAAVRELQRAGGTFFLCERDLKQGNWSAKDLLPGIRIERALSAKELQPVSVGSAAAGPVLQRIRRACSGDDAPAQKVIAAGKPLAATAPPPRAPASAR